MPNESLKDLLNRVMPGKVTSLQIEHIINEQHEDAGFMADVSRIKIIGTGTPDSLILKTRSSDPVRAKMAVRFQSYVKEAFFYEALAATTRGQIPHCYYSAPNDFLLLLEDLAPRSLPVALTGANPDQSNDAVHALALLHATKPPDHALLPKFSEGFRAAAPDMQTFGIEALKRFSDSPATAFMNRYAKTSLDFLPLFEQLPMVFSHMDYRNDNLAYTKDGVVAFDWGEFSLAPPGFDLAYFIVTSLSITDRRARETSLLDVYLQVATDNGASLTAKDVSTSYLLSIPPAFYLAALVLARGEEAKGHRLAQLCLSAIEDHLPDITQLYAQHF